jgi:PAS domain S-box-containing protein
MRGPLLDVWLCTTRQHEPWLLGLVVGICLAASVGGLRLYTHALQSPRQTRSLWLAAAGAVAGSGVWLTHFAATIGFHHVRAVGMYDPVLTLASLGVAIAGFWAAFVVAGLGGRAARSAAGLSLGLVIGGLHYVGVSALAVFGVMSFDPGVAAASIALGSAAGCTAMLLVGGGLDRTRVHLAAGILALGVAALHFTGMAAISVGPGPSRFLLDQAVPVGVLTAFMAVVAGAVLASVCGAALLATRTRTHSLESLRTALDALPAGVAVFDPQDRILAWNERYAEVGGEARGVLAPGRAFRDLLHAELKAGHHPEAAGREAEWMEARLAARALERDEEVERDGVWTRVQDRRTPDGGMVSIITDITPHKAAAEALAEARDRAEAANAAKSEFLANMSHELRTPLNGVVGLASVLAGSDLPTLQREMAQVIVTSSMSLERLLSDVLDLARVEAGRLSIRPEATDPRALLNRIALLHGAAAEAKGLSFKECVDPAVPASLVCDPLRVEQVLNNLLSNAIKFTATGRVELRLRLDGSELVMEVEDTGVGFDPARAETLFARFEQGDGSVTRRYGGSGLGLAISRDLAELMGGRLSAVSEPGRGSCFTLRIPAILTSTTLAEAA